MFQYIAYAELHDGERVHLVLPQIEMFNVKLEQAQRDMGKQPSEFVPIKYSNMADDEADANPMLRLAIGTAFVALCVQLYRTLHGKGGSSGASSTMGKTGGFGGGANPMN